jgi:hypothetical protein
MRKFLLAALCTVAVGCASVSDGPFRQAEGKPINYEKLSLLVEKESTIKDAIAILGEPSSRIGQADGGEFVEYVSVKRRESVERVMGVTQARHFQTMRETVTLVFRGGVLMNVQKSSDISSQ